MKRTLLAAVVLTSCLPPAALAVDEFYMARLRSGQDAYRTKRYVEAADELRIGCFGLLDRPDALAEGLAWLAVAQNAAARTFQLTDTLSRFVEVERRFKVYAKANIEPEVRTEFEALLKKKLAPEILQSLPALASLTDRPPATPQAQPTLPPSERKASFEDLAASEPQNPEWPLELARLAAKGGDSKGAIRWSTKVVELDASNTEALEIRARARVVRKSYGEALGDLKALPAEQLTARPELYADLFVCQADAKDWAAASSTLDRVPQELRTRPDVAKALKKLPSEKPPAEKRAEEAAPASSAPAAPAPGGAVSTPPPAEVTPEMIASARSLAAEGKAPEAARQLSALVPRAPQNRDLRKALLEAACLSKDWRTGASQVPFIEPFADGEEASMFYAAVSLFETGSADKAKTLMSRAKAHISSNPYVDYYARRILGPS